MNNKKREPIYIKLLKINVFLYFITGSSVLGIILNVILYHHLYNPNESKDVILIEIYYWIPATFFIVILINILKLFFIKQTIFGLVWLFISLTTLFLLLKCIC